MTVKGSWQRPADQKKFNDNFDKIFGKKEKKNDKADVRNSERQKKREDSSSDVC